MGKRKTLENNNTSVESAPAMFESNEQEKSSVYVVVRDGFRVSDKEYENETDSACMSEIEFWTRVSQNHSCGEKVEAVLYDSKKHRIW